MKMKRKQESGAPIAEKKIKININSDDLLVDKYRPRVLDELMIPQDKKTAVTTWITSRKENPLIAGEKKTHQILCINGPCSSGKSTLARMCLEDQGYQVCEFDSSSKATVKIIYEAGISLVNARSILKPRIDASNAPAPAPARQKVALLLENIEEWLFFSFADLAKLLTLHKPSIIKIQKEKKSKKGKVKKPNKVVVDVNKDDNEGDDEDEDKKKNEYGLTKQFPHPLVCPIICTHTPAKYGGRKRKKGKTDGFKKFTTACSNVWLDAFSDDHLAAFLRAICKGENISMTRTTQKSLIQFCNHDPRKLLNSIQYYTLSSASTDLPEFKMKKLKSSDFGNVDVYRNTNYLMTNAKSVEMKDVSYFSSKHKDLIPMMYANYIEGVTLTNDIGQIADFLETAASNDAELNYCSLKREISVAALLSKVKRWKSPGKKLQNTQSVCTYAAAGTHGGKKFDNLFKCLPANWTLGTIYVDQLFFLQTLNSLVSLGGARAKNLCNSYRLTDAKLDMLSNCVIVETNKDKKEKKIPSKKEKK
jgi:hypothetical protein